MRPVVYISGPISNGGAATPEQVRHNVACGVQMMRLLIDSGFAPICPQLTVEAERIWGEAIDHGLWIEIDKAIIAKCDAVLRIDGPSVGADMEVDFADEHGIPVLFSVTDLELYFGVHE